VTASRAVPPAGLPGDECGQLLPRGQTHTQGKGKTGQDALTIRHRSLLAICLLRGIHLVVDLGHGLLEILGRPH
jgi:hypothetical protein